MPISFFQPISLAPTSVMLKSLADNFRSGKHEQAMSLARDLSGKFPKHPMAWAVMGAIYRARHENLLAKPCLERVVEISPSEATAHFNLANALRDLGFSVKSAEHYRKALRLNPSLPNGFFNLGNMQHETGQWSLAEKSFRTALEQTPDHVECICNLAVLLQDTGRGEEAMEMYERAIDLRPTDVALLCNRVDLLHERWMLKEAEAEARRILTIAPNYSPAYMQLAGILMDTGDYEASIEASRSAVRVDECNPAALSSLLFALNYYSGANIDESFALARRYGSVVSSKVVRIDKQWSGSNSPSSLRVGFISGDLRNHPVGYFLERVLSHIDPSRISLVALKTQMHEDDLTDRLRPTFCEWHSIALMGDTDAATFIRSLGLHIVLDLSGHTAGGRLPLMAYRLAPVQASWLGYFATTGVSEIDYLIADEISLPPECESQFTERIWRLPSTRMCFTAPALDIEPSCLPAQTNGYITLGCTSNLLKISDRVIAVWSQILLALPGSRLVLQAKQLSSGDRRKSLLDQFRRYGVDAERIVLKGHVKRADYLGTYRLIDFCIDPFPFPGGTTTAESLWMGVPVLTLEGKIFIGKQGASMMSAVGLNEWIASSEEDYVNRAIRHASDLTCLAEIRRTLRQCALESPLYNAEKFAVNLTEALWGMWKEVEEKRMHLDSQFRGADASAGNLSLDA